MKNILILIFVIFFSFYSFSAVQFNTKGNQSWLTFDSETNLYFEVERSGKDNNHENFIDRGNGVSDYGWYNLNSGETGSFNNGQNYSFSENDKIALWLKDESGNIYISTKLKNSDYIWGKSNVDNDIIRLYGGNKGSNGTHEYYVFKVTSVSSSNTPNGQPLPGIVATMLVGGVGVIYLKKRDKLLKNK